MKIQQLKLQSPDLKATRAFYHDLLGIAIHDEDTGSITFSIGNTLVEFVRATDSKPVYHMAIDIPRNKLEAAYAWLKEKTEVLPVSPGLVFSEFERWNARSLYFYDNNGSILELICRLDLDNATAAAFDTSSFLHISEIGIVSRNVPETAALLQSRYGLELYPKQPPADNFTVMGAEDGLFIIVAEGRNWFPTEVAAGIFPLEIRFIKPDGNEALHII